MDRTDKENLLKRNMAVFGLSPTSGQCSQFLRYYEMIVERNKVMNLTTVTDYREAVRKHFADSLAVAQTKAFQKMTGNKRNASVIDIGSGAGFPGIPVKIMFPETRMTLLDSLNKRVIFLNEVIDELQLGNITALHDRAEEYVRKDGIRGTFDVCLSRAVANLAVLAEYCMPYVKTGGCFISYKSGMIDEECRNAEKAVRILGGSIETIERFTLPDSDEARSLVVIRKKSGTPSKYPRKAGIPAKTPIQ